MIHEQDIQRLIAFLEDRQALPVPGNTLLIRQHGRELFRHFSGEAREDTLFRICSMTKVVTVTAALQLLEQGKFSLDDPVAKYLPEFAELKVWDEQAKQAIPAKNALTVRHLFSMSGGLTYGGEHCETARRITAIQSELQKRYPEESYPTREFIRRLPEAPLAFEPGTRWCYSLCHDVLGALIEALSGKTLGEYMAEHIFDPLGMKNTFFRCPPALSDKMARVETEGWSDLSYGINARYESGGGGLLSTADDYMRFADTLTLGGGGLLKRETVDFARQDQLNETQKADFNWDYLKGYSYGLGVRVMKDPSVPGIPGSVGEFGWCGFLGTWVLMDPAEELTVVYMHQRFPNLEAYVQTSLRRLIYDAIR